MLLISVVHALSTKSDTEEGLNEINFPIITLTGDYPAPI